MYDQVTLGLNVDPFILSALKEDITSEDVSTNSVMPHPQAGEVDLICKQDGVICGLQVFERVFTLLDADTKVEFYVKDGDRVENKQLIGKVYGDIRVLLCGERTALNYLQRMSGIATYTSQVAALLEGTGITVLFVGMSDVVNRMQGNFGSDRDNYMKSLMRPDLLILDDLGAERNTSFGKERVFDVVDKRLLTGKPMIVTTNIPLSVMKQAADLDDRRIFDRILEVCVPIMFDGDSFRKSTAADNLKTAARLLG